MTEKERTSVSIDKELMDDIQRREELNLSGVVNDFLRGYLAHGDATSATLRARLERLQGQRERLEKELEEIEQEIAHVKDTLEAQQTRDDETREQIERLAHDLPDDLHAENPAVQNWARKLNERPTELVAAVEEVRQNGHGTA